MDVFQFKMLRAALKQALRDQQDELTEREIDKILDQINTLTKLIEELEKN